MGVDVYGWVEVQDPSTHVGAPQFPNAWSGVIRIHDIVERSYNVFGSLFDVHNDGPFVASVAGRRGLPPRVSEEAFWEKVSPQDQAAQTWISAQEVRTARQQDLFVMPLGWNLLFTLMGNLAAVYGEERVRLVVWFDSDPDDWERLQAQREASTEQPG